MKTTVYNKFNSGEIDDLALARDDVSRVNSSASLIENFFPMRLGPMQYRPGFGYIGVLLGESYLLPFTMNIGDQAILEFSDNNLRLWVDDELVTRPSVSTVISNGDPFIAGLTSWTASGTGATYVSGTAELTAQTSGAAGYIYQNVTVSGADQNSEHGVSIVITGGSVKCHLGTGGALYSDDLFSGTLPPGSHSFSVTPSTQLDITFSSDTEYGSYIESVGIESSGIMSLPTSVATDKLSTLRMAQSNDVCFMTYNGGENFQLERRGEKSWSIVSFRADDGPFEIINTSDITMSASALSGGTNATPVTLTASRDYFKSAHVGALFKLASAGQQVEKQFGAVSQSSGSIFITGTGSARKFSVLRTVTGSWATTRVTLQSSVDDSTWTNVKDYSSNGTDNYDDGLDNQEIYYRLTTTAWDGATTNVDTTMTFAGGSVEGIARVTEYTSATVVKVQVLRPFGSTDATDNWYEGSWSEARSYPTAVDMFEGRLWFGGNGQLWGSVSDAYSSFDRDVIGDSASIYRTIAFASSSNIHWLSEAIRLIAGITVDEVSVRSSSLNEILTPTNVNLKAGTSQGAAPLDCISMDSSLYFIQRSKRKIMRMVYTAGNDGYFSEDLMTLNESICKGADGNGIRRIAISRQPETRIFALLEDGTARVYLTDMVEDVRGWSRISHGSGLIEDIIVLPGLDEDRVYCAVLRDGVRYLEKMAKIEDARGAAISYHYDSYVFDAGPTTSVACSNIANGTEVRAWSAGALLGSYTVASGAITIPLSSNVVAGIPFNADYISNKLSGFDSYSVLNARIRVENLGMIARDVVLGDIMFGPSFSELQGMPLIEGGDTISHTTTQDEYDYTPFDFNGSYDTDSRVYLRATGPATIMALTYGIQESKNKSRE